MACPICGKQFQQKYQNEQTCGKKCAAKLRGNFKNIAILNKISKTNIEKYGAANPWSCLEIQQKCKLNNDRSAVKLSIKLRTQERHNTEEYKERQRLNALKILSKQISRKELVIMDKIGTTFKIEQQKTFDDCRFKSKLRFDFFRPAQKIILSDGTYIAVTDLLIEYDGEQHHQPVSFNKISTSQMYKNFIETQVKDWYKDLYCISKGLPLIRIDPCPKNDFTAIMSTAHIIGKAQASDDTIYLFDINESDFTNYKEATFIIYSGISCSFKCDKENKRQSCQNWSLNMAPKITFSIDKLIQKFDNQTISKCITFQGLEPLDNLKQLLWFIYKFRLTHDNEIIIWTGYTKEECESLIYLIKEKMYWSNIIVKFGRYIPDQKPHLDPILKVYLASDNQFAEKL